LFVSRSSQPCLLVVILAASSARQRFCVDLRDDSLTSSLLADANAPLSGSIWMAHSHMCSALAHQFHASDRLTTVTNGLVSWILQRDQPALDVPAQYAGVMFPHLLGQYAAQLLGRARIWEVLRTAASLDRKLPWTPVLHGATWQYMIWLAHSNSSGVMDAAVGLCMRFISDVARNQRSGGNLSSLVTHTCYHGVGHGALYYVLELAYPTPTCSAFAPGMLPSGAVLALQSRALNMCACLLSSLAVTCSTGVFHTASLLLPDDRDSIAICNAVASSFELVCLRALLLPAHRDCQATKICPASASTEISRWGRRCQVSGRRRLAALGCIYATAGRPPFGPSAAVQNCRFVMSFFNHSGATLDSLPFLNSCIAANLYMPKFSFLQQAWTTDAFSRFNRKFCTPFLTYSTNASFNTQLVTICRGIAAEGAPVSPGNPYHHFQVELDLANAVDHSRSGRFIYRPICPPPGGTFSMPSPMRS